MLRYWTPGFSPKRLLKRLSQKKHMLTNRDYEQALSCFIPRLFEFCPEPYVCISTLLCECCFCYNNHFGAIGYTRWHRDQLDRGRVYQLVEKTSTLRLAHMMYSCLPWFNNTLGVPELGRAPVIHVISMWFSDPVFSSSLRSASSWNFLQGGDAAPSSSWSVHRNCL